LCELIGILVLVFFTSIAKADEPSVSDLIIPQQQKFLEAEMLSKDLEEFDEWRKKEEQRDGKIEEKATDKSKSCLAINFIEFEGNTVFSKEKLKKIVKDYKYKCLTKNDITIILQKISLLYTENGYVTTQIYIKEQDLKLKLLTIHIEEGRIEDIIVNNDKINTFVVFPGYKNKILNIKDIDQTNDNLLNIPSYQYKPTIKSGSKPGFSIINIDGKRKLPISPFMEFDNIGQAFTGHERYAVGTRIDNIFGLADSLNFKYLSTINGQSGDRHLQSFIASWSMPIKYAKFGFNFAYSDYLTTVHTTNQSFQSKGQMMNGTLFAQATVLRSRHIKTAGFINFNIISSTNYINNTFSQIQSRNLMNTEVGINNNLYTKYGSFFHRISYIRGLGTIGTDPLNQGMFDALRFYQVYTIKFKNTPVPFTYQNTIDAQYASQDLYSQNQFVLGGFYSIRGFRDVNIYGSMGVLMRNDVDFALADYIKSSNKWLQFLTNNGNGGLVFGLFYDIGIAGSYNQATTASGTGAGTLSSANYGYLSGTGFKIRYDSEHIQFNFVFSKSLVYPDYLSSSVANTDNFIVYGSVRLVV